MRTTTVCRRPPARRVAALAALAAVLAGCTPAVPVEVAPNATDPLCADVVLALPDSLGDGLDARDTTSQATAAWGGSGAAVTLRCGVEVLAPTTDRCITVSTPGGAEVDWVVVEGELEANGGNDWTFTTYGRVPAVQVHVPSSVAETRPTGVLDALGTAVSRTRVEGSCLDLSDVG